MKGTTKTASELWQDYVLLTGVMRKFLLKQDVVMFREILGQRDKLQQLIENTNDDGFRQSPDGLTIFEKLVQTNEEITQLLRLLRNRLTQKKSVSQAYDAYAQSMVGFRMDKKR